MRSSTLQLRHKRFLTDEHGYIYFSHTRRNCVLNCLMISSPSAAVIFIRSSRCDEDCEVISRCRRGGNIIASATNIFTKISGEQRVLRLSGDSVDMVNSGVDNVVFVGINDEGQIDTGSAFCEWFQLSFG